MNYIFKHGRSRITVNAGSENNAAKSFKQIVAHYFPDKAKLEWEKTTQEFYNDPAIAAKLHFTNQRRTATIQARAKHKVKTPRIVIKPFHFE